MSRAQKKIGASYGEALRLGLRTYYGKPCLTCSGTERYVRKGRCVSCRHETTRLYAPHLLPPAIR